MGSATQVHKNPSGVEGRAGSDYSSSQGNNQDERRFKTKTGPVVVSLTGLEWCGSIPPHFEAGVLELVSVGGIICLPPVLALVCLSM